MKKIFPLLCVAIFFACKKPIEDKAEERYGKDSAKISLKHAIAKTKMALANNSVTLQSYQSTTTNIVLNQGSAANLSCIQYDNTTDGLVFGTHGYAHWWDNSIYLNTYNNNGSIRGSGVAVRHQFKQGTLYNITFDVAPRAQEIQYDGTGSQNRRPSLQVQLTNSAAPSSACAQSAPVNLTSATGPVATLAAHSDNEITTRTVSFIPESCFDFLRLSSHPNLQGISDGEIIIKSIKITTVSGPEIDGLDHMDVNTQSTYSVSLQNLTISEQFNWTVTGDLQIIGSSTGPTAVIKSTGLMGGSVSVSLNGCLQMATRMISFDPNYYQITSTVSNPGFLCANKPGRSQYYQIPVPSGATVQWSIENGFLVGNRTNPIARIAGDNFGTANTAILTATLSIPGTAPLVRTKNITISYTCP